MRQYQNVSKEQTQIFLYILRFVSNFIDMITMYRALLSMLVKSPTKAYKSFMVNVEILSWMAL